MPINYINTGSGPNSGDADNIRVAFTKVNANFQYLSTTTVQTGSLIFSGDAPPDSYNSGTVWWSSIDGRAYINYNGLWVDLNPPANLNLNNLTGDLIPSADRTYKIGSLAKRWESLNLGYTGITLGGVGAVSLSTSTGNLTFGRADHFLNLNSDGGVVLQAKYNSGAALYIQGSNTSGAQGGSVYIQAGADPDQANVGDVTVNGNNINVVSDSGLILSSQGYIQHSVYDNILSEYHEWVNNNDGTTSFPGYTLPYPDGSEGQTLITSGTGTVSWGLPSRIYNNGHTLSLTTSGSLLIPEELIFPDGSQQTTAWTGTISYSDISGTPPAGSATTSSLINGSYTATLDDTGLINLPGGGQLGAAQAVHQNGGPPSVDLYASADMAWVQLNYDENVYIVGGSSGAQIQTNERASSYTWNFNNDGTMTVPGMTTVSGDIIPDSDSVYSLGSTSSQWHSLYVSSSTIYLGGVPVGISTDSGTLIVGGNSVVTYNTSGQFVANGAPLTGAVGPTGPRGPSGANGANGANGAAGPQGPTGPSGANGANGAAGPQGPTGPNPVVSDSAPTGATTGTLWYNSISGRTYIYFEGYWVDSSPAVAGPQGNTGPTGPQGSAGADGVDGTSITIKGHLATASTATFTTLDPVPTSGDAYITDDTGDLWVYTGSADYNGFDNVGNIRGPQGPQGARGPTGPTGPNGSNGPTGPSGPAGASGAATTSSLISGTSTAVLSTSGVLTTPLLSVTSLATVGSLTVNGPALFVNSTNDVGAYLQSTGRIIWGGVNQTGEIRIGQPTTVSQTINIANAAITTGNTQTINIGTQQNGGQTRINIGNTTGTVITIAGTATVNGSVIITTATIGNYSGGVSSLTNIATDITFNTVGVGAPTFNTASSGTKISYYPNESASSVDYATGIEAGVLWNSIPQATNSFAYKWYAGTTTVALLSGLGTLTANKFVGDGSSLTNITVTQQANIVGSQPNVTLVAGNYTYLFDNTGNFTMPYNGDIVMTGTNANLIVAGTATVAGAVVITTATIGNYAASFNTATLVASAVTATYANTATYGAGGGVIITTATINPYLTNTVSYAQASFVKYTRSNAQTSSISAGNLIITPVLESSYGTDISVNTSTGQVTLAANRTYRLRGAVPNFSGSAGSLQYCWYNETSSGYIGEGGSIYAPTSNAAYGATGGPAEAVISTTATTVVSFRVLNNTNVTGLGGNTDFAVGNSYPWIDIQTVGAVTPVTAYNITATSIKVTSNVDAVSTTTGALQVVGGVGLGGSVYVGGNVTVNGQISQPNRPAFRVYGAGTTNNLGTTVNTNGILNGNNFAVDYQQGSYLNTSTGVFTAPLAGLYSIHLNARVVSNTTSSAQVIVIKNYATTSSNMVMWETGANPSINHFGVSTIAKLAVGDTLVVKVTVGAINFDINDNWAVAYIG